MRSFRSRNPIPIGIAGIVVIGLALTVAMFSDDLPIIGGGTSYSGRVQRGGRHRVRTTRCASPG